jgi:hypothetical protein
LQILKPALVGAAKAGATEPLRVDAVTACTLLVTAAFIILLGLCPSLLLGLF